MITFNQPSVYTVYKIRREGGATVALPARRLDDVQVWAEMAAGLHHDCLYRVFLTKGDTVPFEQYMFAYVVLNGKVHVHKDVTIPSPFPVHYKPIGGAS